MKYTLCPALLASALLLFTACQKNDEIVAGGMLIIDPTSRQYGVDVSPETTIVSAPGESKFAFLDVNQDGDDDFCVTVRNKVHAEGGGWRSVEIGARGTGVLSMVVAPYSSTLCSYIDNSTTPAIRVYEAYDPSKSYPSLLDIQPATQGLLPSPLSADMTISESDVFQNIGNAYIAYQDSSFGEGTRTVYPYGNWLPGTHAYVGFRKEEKGKRWYGWIDLEVKDFDEVVIHRFVAQRMKNN